MNSRVLPAGTDACTTMEVAGSTAALIGVKSFTGSKGIFFSRNTLVIWVLGVVKSSV